MEASFEKNGLNTGMPCHAMPKDLEHFKKFYIFKSCGRKDGVKKTNTFSEGNNMKFYAVLSHVAKCGNLRVKLLRN